MLEVLSAHSSWEIVKALSQNPAFLNLNHCDKETLKHLGAGAWDRTMQQPLHNVERPSYVLLAKKASRFQGLPQHSTPYCYCFSESLVECRLGFLAR